MHRLPVSGKLWHEVRAQTSPENERQRSSAVQIETGHQALNLGSSSAYTKPSPDPKCVPEEPLCARHGGSTLWLLSTQGGALDTKQPPGGQTGILVA